jgi:pteridine reductase
MPSAIPTTDRKAVLITGAAHRIGATLARVLHQAGMDLILHYRRSDDAARSLQAELEAQRPGSVVLVRAELLDERARLALVREARAAFGHLDVLINNASSFYPTPIGNVTEAQWEDLIGTNLKAPFFLAQEAAPVLRAGEGCIINLVDIHGERPLKDHPVYSIAKAGLIMLTRALARELGPHVRVNGIAPGAILWPEHGLSEEAKREILDRTALKRHGHPKDVARAALYFIREAPYVTGQVLCVDGGRSLSQ